MADHLRTSSLALLTSLVMSACTVVPGGDIHGNTNSGFFNPTREAQLEKDLDDKVNIVTIDSNVIKKLKRQDELTEQLQTEADAKQSAAEQIKAYHYHVGVGDILSITVWDHPELTLPTGTRANPEMDGTRVSSDGSIFFPYAGKLQVMGKTTPEIRDELATKLASAIKEPQVAVKVAQYNSQKVYVTGEVNMPGTFPITDVPMTVVEAISHAQGLKDDADWQQVILNRGDKHIELPLARFYQQGDKSGNILLKDGDVLNVRRNDNLKVFMMGEVRDPQPVVISRYGLSLADALNQVGGIDENRADGNGIFVLRARQKQSEKIADVYQLNMRNATALVMADQFELQPRDIVYVTSAPLARWNKIISLLVPSVTVIDRADNIGN